MIRDPRDGALPGDDAMPLRHDSLLNQNGPDPVPSAVRKRPRRQQPAPDAQSALEESLRIVASPGAARRTPSPAEEDRPDREPMETFLPIRAPRADAPNPPRRNRKVLALGAGALAVGLFAGGVYELSRGGRLPIGGAGRTTVASSEQRPAMPPGKPDPALTPGSASSIVFRPEVAGVLGAASPAVPEGIRRDVFRAYGIPESEEGKYVPVRLIPPSLNGDDSAANILPMTPWFSNLKARLDKELTVKVASGRMTVAGAHKELTGDWIAAAHKHYVRNYGEQDEAAAKRAEEGKAWAKPSPAASASPASGALE